MNHERSYNHSKEQLPNRISGPVPNRCDSVDGMVFSNNPPLGKTGASGEGTCADCHGGGAGAERLRLPRRLELSINPASNIT
jgi:hypothetical protein